MIRNYLLIALRQLTRHRLFSALNILSLSMGICFCLLIGQYVLHERSVNRNLRNVGQQYFLNSHWKVKDMGLEVTTLGPLAKAMKQRYPDLVANYYRFNPITNVVSAGDRHFKENIAIGDTTMISMFGYPLLYGDPAHAFANSSSAVITEDMAVKLYGDRNAIGRILTINNTTGTTQDFKVSGVLKSQPFSTVNNYFDKDGYTVYVPFEGNGYYQSGTGEDSWSDIFTAAFVELQPGIKPSQLDAAVRKLIALNAPENLGKNLEVNLRPVETYYLKGNDGAVEKTLAILSLVTLGILLLAIINFVNIMIGTSAYRIREIGLRKVFGGRKLQLVMQYLCESVVLTICAGIFSLLFYVFLRPVFNDILQTDLPGLFQFTAGQTGLLVLLVVLVGVLAGIYPAFILSTSEVVASVKGKLNLGGRSNGLRKVLLVTQFAVATLVFILAITISKQVSYFFNRDLGYNKDQVLVITAYPKQWDSAGVARMQQIRNGLLQVPSVLDASISYEIPDRKPPLTSTIIPEGSQITQPLIIPTLTADENFASTFGLHLLNGRFFGKKDGSFISNEMVITEAAGKAFGWKDAIGKKVKFDGNWELTVVGVIKDFNFSTLQEPMGPLVIIHSRDAQNFRFLSVKLQAGNIGGSVARVKEAWKTLAPTAPFDYFFMDDRFRSLYAAELHLKKAAAVATALMGLIVLLGVFGVLTLALTRRTKEIAVRKVLGAEIYHIVILFLKQYAGLIGVALVIAWPLAYMLSSRWLEQYAYRITQDMGNYLLVGAVVAGMAFLLIGVQCLRVALTNPVKSLKEE